MTANQIAYAKNLEDVRTHKVQEAETERANRAREAENQRVNTLNYNLGIYGIQADMWIAERNAQVKEYLEQLNIAQRQKELEEQNRHNIVAEDQARKELTERTSHDLATERQAERKTNVDIVGTVINGIGTLVKAASTIGAFI